MLFLIDGENPLHRINKGVCDEKGRKDFKKYYGRQENYESAQKNGAL